MEFEIDLYETETGACPVAKFLSKLPSKLRGKVTTYLEKLEEGGPYLGEPYTRHLRGDLFELRCNFGSDSVRLVFFYHQHNTIVVTNAFLKKSQRTPIRELNLANQRRIDYLRRNPHET